MKKLFIDFDGTLTDSVKKICEMYNFDYKNHPDFIPAKDYLVNAWNFSDQCPLIDKDIIEDYFCQKRFFINLEFLENAKEIVDKLSKHYDIYIVSMGKTNNLIYKNQWLKENLKCIKRFIGCNYTDYDNKSHINMQGGILIDDNSNNLETSNADITICYGDIYSWNEDWEGKRCWNWYEVEKYLIINEDIDT